MQPARESMQVAFVSGVALASQIVGDKTIWRIKMNTGIIHLGYIIVHSMGTLPKQTTVEGSRCKGSHWLPLEAWTAEIEDEGRGPGEALGEGRGQRALPTIGQCSYRKSGGKTRQGTYQAYIPAELFPETLRLKATYAVKRSCLFCGYATGTKSDS